MYIIHITKYNLVHLCNVIYMYVFWSYYLVLDNQLVWVKSLEKTICPVLAFFHFWSSLYTFSHLGFSLSILAHLLLFLLEQFKFRQIYWQDFASLASDIPRRHNFTANSLIIWEYSGSTYVFLQCPLSLRCGNCFVDVSTRNRLPNSAFWSIWGFCDCLHLLQRVVSLMRGENYPYL